ncbi:MAG: lactoylglutathione lyase-like lyase [Frondihabitans sp.]|nr:lactoylglutathione lyase-like lyase [Frondihabitans sp.]
MFPLPALRGIHHLKLAVSDIDVSLDFYERSLGARRIPEADHRRQEDGSLYAVILEIPGLGTLLELRRDPHRADLHRGFDPVTIAVSGRADLDDWDAWLTEHEVLHSPVIIAIQAWLIVIEDPDGNRIRLYTLEQHGPELTVDESNPWIALA